MACRHCVKRVDHLCIAIPAGEVTRETIEQAAQRWIDAQS